MTAGANIINDIYDVELDRINKPGRPLPAGKITTGTAWQYFVISYFFALLGAAFCGWKMLAIAVLIGLLLAGYGIYFKRTVLAGNVVVSLSSAMAFIYGALAVDDWEAGIVPAAFAFFFHFGREVIKDMQDVPGDRANNVVTFPGLYGNRPSVVLINIIFLILIILTFIPYILSIYGTGYLLIVVPGVDLVLAFTIISLWFRQDAVFLGRLSHLLKIDMFVGLMAIVIGARNVVFLN